MAILNKEGGIAFFLFALVLNRISDVFGIQPQPQAPSVGTRSTTLFPILFESPRVLVVRKPHGISHHDEALASGSESKEGTSESITPGVLRLLRKERQQLAGKMGERLYGVHRLDKVTSGILVFAKDATTASILSEFFAEGKIQKIYFGLSAKKPKKKKQGLVQGGMTRSRNKSWRLVRKPTNGQKNTTENFAKTRFFSTGLNATGIDDARKTSLTDSIANVKTVTMFRPYTGKTHQLRVAAKAMGIPLLGDPIYKDGNAKKSENAVMTTTRTMLHASGIHIPEFLDEAEINVWCPPTFFFDCEVGENKDSTNGDHAVRALLSDALEMAVEKLMMKNCDVHGILETMSLKH